MFCRAFLSDARIESNQKTSAKTVIFVDKCVNHHGLGGLC
ncbi:hypothetical protein GXM_10097 [Nostoc sphaeroides CCNUC1]|uniref:Uncharacterized protein n=1 Tax=Nostoc sphaeroides CCNUC1 TaxID=2653204 RepID=A0A5P8WJ06_9NOSO|nr:hypothetical protein GXM_10097 [Nostoc sphaeroides CCNUC1]